MRLQKIALDRTHKDKVNLQNVTHDFAYDQRVRLERIKEVCASSDRPPGNIKSLITRANLTYCVIPRSSNTFWLQIYRYLNYDFLEENPRSPFDLDVSQVHNRPFARTRQHTWRRLTEANKKVILASRIFLAVQDPYMRLWTTYLNSLVLPDLWSTVGIKIEAKRNRGPTVIKKRVSTVGLCGADVTFSEFVDYALESYEAEYDTFYHQCDPCQLSPTYIVKAETAWRDNQHVLGHFNLSWVVDAPDFQEEMTKRNIQNTIKNNFARMRDPLVKNCVVHGDIARKVWKIFTLQGLIPEDAPQPDMDDIVQDTLTNIILEQYFTSVQRGLDIAGQKRKFMASAFRHLKVETLKRIQDKYRIDFSMFGYDEEPGDIFVPKKTSV